MPIDRKQHITELIRKIRRVGIYVLAVLVIICFVSSINFIRNQFKLGKIIVIGDIGNLNGLDYLDGDNLIFLDTAKLEKTLSGRNPRIESLKITKQFPRTLILDVKERIPVAKITSRDDLYVDHSGIILRGPAAYTALPVIFAANISVGSGQKADWRIQKAVSFIEEASKQSISVKQITLNDASGLMDIGLKTGTEVFVPYDADVTMKASSLQVIILRFTIMGKNITKVDFRFDKPLVTLVNGEKISSSF